MSRFYEVLKEASLGPLPKRVTRAREEPVDWTEFGISADAAASALENLSEAPWYDPGPVEAAAPASKKGEGFRTESPAEVEQEIPRHDAPAKTGSMVNTADVTLDRTTRLLPHVIDRSIVEHYRRLRTQIIQQQVANPFRTLLVTSASPNEGKTVTVLNLGLSFGMLPDAKVLVVDGDLRRGTLGKWLGIEGRPGLSNLIEGTATLEDVVLRCDDIPIHFVVSGTSKVPPGELLQSAELSSHFRRMAEHFSVVLVDSPPVNMITDTHLLAASCDAVMLVARAFSSTRRLLQKAAQDLASYRIIGAILNGGTNGKLSGRYCGY